MVLSPGTKIAHYEVVSFIGAGGMGEVYRGRDGRLDRDVALKVLTARLSDDQEMRARFEHEARAIAALSHPSIMAIHDLASHEGRPVAVIELIEGETLRSRLAAGPLPWRDVVQIGARVADGLAAAHDKGIVHRDLKPENIMLGADLRPKILDFGLARNTAAPLDASARTMAVTEPGRLMGTIGYLAPEQIRGEPATAASDLFALGCTLAEMLTGRRPFVKSTAGATFAAVLHDPAPPLETPSGAIPSGLARVVAHCLEKEVEHRFRSARDVSAALRAIQADSGAIEPAPRRRAAKRALAVLPFVNLGGDADAEYLCDGITESVINALSQLPRLRVVPRATVFRYKGREPDLASVGLALNVEHLVTGRVSFQGDHLNVQAELVDMRNEAQVWGDQFRLPVADLMLLQEQLAWQVSEALRIRLTGEEKKRLRRRPTGNSAAYQAYLRGRHQWAKWTPEGFRQAIAFFEQAIGKDPAYARAYSGLGDTYGAMGYYGFLPPAQAMPRASAAARRALELDPELGEAHTTMGLAQLFHDWDFAGAERSFRHAIELAPREAGAHTFYSLLLATQGRTEEAVAEARRGRDLDPLSGVMQIGLGWALSFARRHQESIEVVRELIAIEPDFAEAHSVLVINHEKTGDLRAAAEVIVQARGCFGMTFDRPERLRDAAAEGPDAYWRMRRQLLREIAEGGGYVPPYAQMVAHARLGETDALMARLEQVIAERSPQAVFVGVDEAFDACRADPRFEACLRRIGLPVLASTP